MRATNGDRLAEAHKFRQHFSATNDWQQLFAGSNQFGIAFLDGSGNNDDFRIANVFRPMSNKALDALGAQALETMSGQQREARRVVTAVFQRLQSMNQGRDHIPPRRDTDAKVLAGLRPAFRKDGTITAGSASQISDGAAAVVVMSKAKAEALGLTWLAE